MFPNLVLYIASLSFLLHSVFGACPPFSGSFFINQEQLYPEGADWDPATCRLFVGGEFNSTLVIYDPYNRTTKVIEFPDISVPGNSSHGEYHLNGVDYDAKSGHMFVSVSSALAFTSIIVEQPGGYIGVNYSAANYTGANHILIFDPVAEKLVADVNLLGAQAEYHNLTGQYTNGFQDMAEIESTGDSYAIGTFGNSIVRIAAGTYQAHLWYAPPEYNKTYGFGGVFASGDKLVVSDIISGGLVTFDTRETNPKATYVKLQGLPNNYKPLNADGVYAPKRYGGKVALWSDDYNGTSVYASTDNWSSAHFIGLVLHDDPTVLQASMTTASFEIGESIYYVPQVFQFKFPLQQKKNFPFFDITPELDAIVKNSFVGNLTRF